MMAFKLGDTVYWISQSQGRRTEKIGDVVEIVPADVSLSQTRFADRFKKPGDPRNDESYIVCVGPKPGSKAKPKYYWPRVSSLELWDGE